MSFKLRNGCKQVVLRGIDEETRKALVEFATKHEPPKTKGEAVAQAAEFQKFIDDFVAAGKMQEVGFLGGTNRSPKVLDERGRRVGACLPGDIFSQKKPLH